MPAIASRHPSRRILKPAQRKEMIRLVLEDGWTVNAVANRFNVSWTAVDYWVQKAKAIQSATSLDTGGVIRRVVGQRHKRGRLSTARERSKAISLIVDDGLSINAAAGRTGWSRGSVTRWLEEDRLERSTPAAPPAECDCDQPMDAHLQNESTIEQDVTSDACMPEQGPVQEVPLDSTAIGCPGDACDGLRDQLNELLLERDFLRLIIAHFIAPTMDASGFKVTFSAE